MNRRDALLAMTGAGIGIFLPKPVPTNAPLVTIAPWAPSAPYLCDGIWINIDGKTWEKIEHSLPCWNYCSE